MELSSFSENVIEVPFERNGQTVNLRINIDAFTPNFFRAVGKMLNRKLPVGKGKTKKRLDFEQDALLLEHNREAHADLLTCRPDPDHSPILAGWDVTENGMPLEPSKEVLIQLPPRLVGELWDLCMTKAKTVKKTADVEATRPQTMSEAIEIGSPEFSLEFSAQTM